MEDIKVNQSLFHNSADGCLQADNQSKFGAFNQLNEKEGEKKLRVHSAFLIDGFHEYEQKTQRFEIEFPNGRQATVLQIIDLLYSFR